MAVIEYAVLSTTGTEALKNIRKLNREYGRKIIRGLTRKVLPEQERRILRVVRMYPPRRDARPFIWSRDPVKQARARRWFYANYPNGYTRTRGMAKGWGLNVDLVGDDVLINLANDNEGASWVHGSEDRGQVPGHITTGWKHVDVFVAHTEEAVSSAIIKYNDEIMDSYGLIG